MSESELEVDSNECAVCKETLLPDQRHKCRNEDCRVRLHSSIMCKGQPIQLDNQLFCSSNCFSAVHPSTDVPGQAKKSDQSPLALRHDYFSKEGKAQLLLDVQSARGDDAYNAGKVMLRQVAVGAMRNDPTRFAMFIGAKASVVDEVQRVLNLSREELSQSLLESHIRDMAKNSTWGDELSLSALCFTTQMSAKMYKIEGESAISHPALSSILVDTEHPNPNGCVTLVHTADQTHYLAGLPETVADELKLGGVSMKLQGSEERLVVFGQPGDGACKFGAFWFCLSKLGFDFALLEHFLKSQSTPGDTGAGSQSVPSWGGIHCAVEDEVNDLKQR